MTLRSARKSCSGSRKGTRTQSHHRAALSATGGCVSFELFQESALHSTLGTCPSVLHSHLNTFLFTWTFPCCNLSHYLIVLLMCFPDSHQSLPSPSSPHWTSVPFPLQGDQIQLLQSLPVHQRQCVNNSIVSCLIRNLESIEQLKPENP